MMRMPYNNEVSGTLLNAGFECFVVGGYVRDLYTGGLESHDIDFTTNARPEQIKELFPDAIQTGANFPVMRVGNFEVATFRKDIGVSGWEYADTIEEDLLRRDLTMNAIAVDTSNHRVIDPTDGQVDIKTKTIRFVGNAGKRISEDPVRMLRALRFAAKLEFKLDAEAHAAIEWNSYRLKEVAGERVWAELMKVMHPSVKRASWFFELAYQTKCLQVFFPEMAANYGFSGGLYHNETVWRHLMLTGDAIAHDGNELLRFAAYIHDIGKAPAWNGQNFRYHPEKGGDICEVLASRFKCGHDNFRYIKGLVLLHMRNIGEEVHDRTYRRLLRDLAEYGVPREDFLAMRIADHEGNLKNIHDPYHVEWIDEFFQRCEKVESQQAVEFSTNDLKIRGRELISDFGMKPSPQMGEIINHLFQKVLDDPALNTYTSLKEIIKADFGIQGGKND